MMASATKSSMLVPKKTIRSRSSRPMTSDSAPLMDEAGVCVAAEIGKWRSKEEEDERARGLPREEKAKGR